MITLSAAQPRDHQQQLRSFPFLGFAHRVQRSQLRRLLLCSACGPLDAFDDWKSARRPLDGTSKPMDAAMALIMYERIGLQERRPSPFSWRIRYALAHKSVPVEYRPVRFADVETIRSLSGQDKVPIRLASLAAPA